MKRSLPASMQVFERGWLSSNNVLFTGPEASALVDSGYHSHAAQTVALVQAALGTRALDLLLTTHLHADHCGGNARLQATYRCQTLIPDGDAATVRHWDPADFNYSVTGQQCEPFRFEGTLIPGQSLTLGGLAWTIFAAAGHDPHAVMLYCPAEEILIAADALWENGFGVVFPELEGKAGFDATRQTLERIAGLPLRLVIPGHGPPFEDTQAALGRAFTRLERFTSDPVQHARYAVKVLLKFLLLEHQAIERSALAARFASIRLVEETNARFLGLSNEALCAWVVTELLQSGAAALDGPLLVNAQGSRTRH